MIRIQKLIKHKDGSKSDPDNTLGGTTASFRIGNYCVSYRDYVEYIGIGLMVSTVVCALMLILIYGAHEQKARCINEYTIEEQAIYCPVNAMADHILRQGDSNE